MRKGPDVADDPTADVHIYYPHTDPEKEDIRTVPAGALGGFTNSGWVVVDAAGRRKAQQPVTPSKES